MPKFTDKPHQMYKPSKIRLEEFINRPICVLVYSDALIKSYKE